MTTYDAPKAYENLDFLHSREARSLRILAEYQEPLSRFEQHEIDDTIVFMGSARLKSGEGDPEAARRATRIAVYYEAARELAF